jgi:hypothetical protein
MSSAEEINRLVNRGLRVLNEVAVKVAASRLADRKLALNESTEAVTHLTALQRLIVREDPSLEYHYDPKREPTIFMKKIGSLVDEAEALLRAGKTDDAACVLRRARDLEPPPLTYEMLSKKLESLGKHLP